MEEEAADPDTFFAMFSKWEGPRCSIFWVIADINCLRVSRVIGPKEQQNRNKHSTLQLYEIHDPPKVDEVARLDRGRVQHFSIVWPWRLNIDKMFHFPPFPFFSSSDFVPPLPECIQWVKSDVPLPLNQAPDNNWINSKNPACIKAKGVSKKLRRNRRSETRESIEWFTWSSEWAGILVDREPYRKKQNVLRDSEWDCIRVSLSRERSPAYKVS